MALELAGPLLTRVEDTFGNITNTDTDDYLQALEVEINPVDAEVEGFEDGNWVQVASRRGQVVATVKVTEPPASNS